MRVELQQATRSLEEAEAAISFGDFTQLHDLLQQTTQLLDTALGQLNDSMVRIEALHELQQSFEEPRSPSPEEEMEEELALVA
jgi:hypothetical protein